MVRWGAGTAGCDLAGDTKWLEVQIIGGPLIGSGGLILEVPSKVVAGNAIGADTSLWVVVWAVVGGYADSWDECIIGFAGCADEGVAIDIDSVGGTTGGDGEAWTLYYYMIWLPQYFNISTIAYQFTWSSVASTFVVSSSCCGGDCEGLLSARHAWLSSPIVALMM